MHVVGAGLLSTRENSTIPVEHTVSNPVTISIASDGGPCTDPSGLNGPELAALQAKNNIRLGRFNIVRRPGGLLETAEDTASGEFARLDTAAFLRSRGIFGLPALGSCLQFQVPHEAEESAEPVRGSMLDAGQSLTISGPGGSRTLARNSEGSYFTVLGGTPEQGAKMPPYLTPGANTLAGSGGTDVGAFAAPFAIAPVISWTNRDPEALARSFSPTFQWSLNGPADYVVAHVYGRNDRTAFYGICTEDPSKRSLTIQLCIRGHRDAHQRGARRAVDRRR